MSFRALSITSALVLLALAGSLAGQSTPPRVAGLALLTPSGRKSLPTVTVGDREMLSLDDVAPVFQLSLREDTLAGGLTVSYKGKTIVLTPDQSVASVAGRLVSLPSAVVREGRRWLVPLEFLSRALAAIYDVRLEYRRASRLVILGDLRVPRVVGHEETVGSQGRLTLEVAARATPTIVQEANRLVINFDADALDASLPAAGVPGLIESVRVVDPGAAIAIGLGPKYASYRASTVPVDAGTTRVVIDVLAAGAEAAPPPAPVPAAPAPPGPPPAPPGLTPAPPSVRTVVLDPGHGGSDTGARGADGTLEKDVTLALARRLKAALEARLGLRVILTRDGDATVAADERAALANNNKADLFLSLHANASFRRDVSGTQIYYLSADATPAADRTRGQLLATLGGGAREINVIPWEMAQTGHLADSAALAEIVRRQLSARVPMNARPLERAPLRVLVGANMPAVVVEAGFLSNPGQEKQLRSNDFQALLAAALFDAIVGFRDFVEHGGGPLAPPPSVGATPRG